MSIESLFSAEILRTAHDTTLAEVAKAMVAQDVGGMLAFDAGDLVGVITERDIARAAVREPDISRARVSEYMTPDPWVVPVDCYVLDPSIRAAQEFGIKRFVYSQARCAASASGGSVLSYCCRNAPAAKRFSTTP